MNYLRTIPLLFPEEASALKSTLEGLLVYKAKTDFPSLGVAKNKIYYVDENGQHILFGSSLSTELLFTSVDGVTIEETTGSAIGDGIGSKVVNVSEISKHTIYKIELQGFLDIEDTPENIVIKLKLGSTELVSDTFTAINFPGLTDEPIKATYYIGINSTGSSGGVIASSEFHTSVYSLNITGTVTGGSATPVAVDLSTNKTIDITVNAGTGCTWKTAIVEIQKLN